MRFCTSCGLATDYNNATDHSNATTEIVNPQITVKSSGAATDPLIGRVLDSKYELGARLGEGGMGTVYRARRLHIGDEVAVKVLHPQFLRESGGIERFRREARSAALIRHSNIVAIHDFSDAQADGAAAYIVMELVRGTSLRDILRQELKLDSERAVAIMRDVCAGVAVAHRQGIVHRDLKPDNIIVVPPDVEGERETAKVLDFGLAKLRDNAAEMTLTQTGMVMGTPYYMSPEQWRGEELDARADVYSLGAMLYEMLSASPPFKSTSAAALMAKHLTEEPPLLQADLQISPALEAVCRRALSKTPDERQKDAAELSRELLAAMATPAITQRPVIQPPITRPPIATSNAPFAASPSPSVQWQHESPLEPKSNRTKWIAGGLLTLLIASVITVIAITYLTRNEAANNNSPARPQSTDNTAAVPNTAQTEAASPGDHGMTGTWTGTYGPLGTPATLLIKEQKGGEWSGVLEQGSTRVAFTGTIDDRSRKLTFKETEVISGGDGWSLGENKGELSPDGRRMSGTGQDAFGSQLGMSYPWSFSKR
ncbi:MAG TPA: protein kinase [Blastocatellia bacterium]|nr:protein kinase [Blastocatellia bacterium]